MRILCSDVVVIFIHLSSTKMVHFTLLGPEKLILKSAKMVHWEGHWLWFVLHMTSYCTPSASYCNCVLVIAAVVYFFSFSCSRQQVICEEFFIPKHNISNFVSVLQFINNYLTPLCHSHVTPKTWKLQLYK